MPSSVGCLEVPSVVLVFVAIRSEYGFRNAGESAFNLDTTTIPSCSRMPTDLVTARALRGPKPSELPGRQATASTGGPLQLKSKHAT